MPAFHRPVRVLAVVLLGSLSAAPAFAALSASATISTPQTTAPYHYTIDLENTGTTDIGTFWFAWTATPANYDFLPSSPSNISTPAGWLNPVSHNGIPGDGYGIEWYNYFGSNIAAGGSQTFMFTSNESPATIAGNAWFPGNKVSTSFVYEGFPQTDPGFKFDVQVVPEPTGVFASAALAALAMLLKHRRP